MSEKIDVPSDAETAAVASDLRVVVARLRRRMRETGEPGDFSPSQSAVLARLDSDGPSTVTALARAEGVRQQSMGSTVAALQQSGYITATPHPTDGRQTLLALSDRFRDELHAHRAAKEDWLFRTIRAALTPEEQHQLATGVALLKRVADA
ncbi:MarR family winged helix-turn-helix transcriptional regulator [Kitasatospora herbaricolor]|uniref:MarR family winged helix-turn-helix transcriptional regulator n=1 Tax=Kitasatospora herbaricolor TaxID=68217 RepID=UPI0036DA5DF6